MGVKNEIGMTKEQKEILVKMLYFINYRRFISVSFIRNYIRARNQANWILAAIGEKLEDE